MKLPPIPESLSTGRRRFLHAALGAASMLPAQPARQRPPNIVLIMADDFGYECLACNGATAYKTPRLDALAATGVRFTNAHATPLCTPTRVQLMTGKYNFRNYTEFGSLPRSEFTFAHFLQQAGYRTAVAGKWQLAGAIPGQGYKGEGTLPAAAGFEESYLWQVKARESRYWDPLLEINGELQPPAAGKYGPDLFADFAIRFIERHRERPFFFYYPMALTHDPFVPTPFSKGVTEEQKHKADPRWFGDMVAYADHVVGRIVDKIDAAGLGRDTLILFTGDNGTGRGITTPTENGPYRGGKGTTTLAGTHVPLLARWAGTTPKGRVCDDLIDFTDFFPTIAEAVRSPMPSDHPKDGRSFLAQIEGRPGNPREWIFCHYDPRWGKAQPARWVMNRRWKLYADGRFIDLLNDPREQSPLADLTPEMKAAASKFSAVLAKMVRT